MPSQKETAGRVERILAGYRNTHNYYRQKSKFPQDQHAGYSEINAAVLAAGLPLAWYPAGKHYGQSLRIGNMIGDPGGSFWICLRTGAWKDHATGEGGGDLISLYAARERIAHGEAKQRLAEMLGHNEENLRWKSETAKRTNNDRAKALWQESMPVPGTQAELYLKARGISMMPDSLRFHPETYHGPTRRNYPAMIAAITCWPNQKPHAVHRTFLNGDKKADLDPSRMMLGEIGGGAVRLSQVHDVLAVGEGIETCLSFQQTTGIPTWAALSANNYRNLTLPPSVKEITVAADNDAIGLSKAHEAAAEWARQGIVVRVVFPSEKGMDFNDIHKREKQ